MAPPRVIDHREAERRERLVRELDLRRTDPELLMLEATMAGRPESLLMTKLARLRDERISGHIERQATNPFPTAPRSSISQGEILLGYQKSDGATITVRLTALPHHTWVAGPTRSGKTSFAANIIQQVRRHGVHVWAVDPKDDLRWLANQDNDFLIFHPDLALNLLQRVPYLSVPEQVATFTTIFARCNYAGEQNKQVAWEAYTALTKTMPNGSLRDLQQHVEQLYSNKETYARRDGIRGMTMRLQRPIDLFPGPSTTRDGITFNTLFDHSLLLSIPDELDGTGLFIPTFLLHHLYQHRRHEQRRGGLSHLVSIDEGLQTLGKNPATIEGQAPLSHEQSVVGEYGIGMIVTTTNLTLTDPLLRSNAGIQAALPVTSNEEVKTVASTMGLTPDQTTYLQHHLAPGEVILRIPDWPYPLLGTFPQLAADKNVPPEEWERAITRTNRHAPSLTTAPNTPSTTPPAHDDTTERRPLPITPNIPTPTHVPPGPVTPPEATERVIALNTAEEALLLVVCDGVAASTPGYRKAGLGLADGDNAARHLAQKGLIERERIVVHAGRGGTAMGLRATTSGYDRAGKERPLRVRRGSVQHEYPVQELHRILPGSTVEGMVGTKPVDLLLPLNTERDSRLLEYLRPHLPTGIALNTGSLIAIEVEVSDPAKTGANNLTKNTEAGITLTIIAVLPKDEKPTRNALKDHPARFVVVNVLHLLQALKG